MGKDTLLDMLETLEIDLGFLDGTPLSGPAAAGARFGQSFNTATIHIRQLSAIAPIENAPGLTRIIETVLSRIGLPIDCPADSKLDSRPNWYRVGAGWLKMNPAMVSAQILEREQGKAVQVVALAREGLINQNTAPKAADRFEKELRRQGMQYVSEVVMPTTRLTR